MRMPVRLLIAAALIAAPCAASSFSFVGSFATDDQVDLFTFTLASSATVTFQSWGYGGGTDAAGILIPPGGFDSFFTWYAADGTQIGTDDDGCGNAHPDHGACLDAYAQIFLSAGTYTLALTESGNEPIGDLSQGFTEQGAGDFTASGTCTAFCDTFGNQDDGNFAVDILNVTTASGPGAVTGSAPEPATVFLTLCGLSLIAIGRRRTH